MSSRCVTYEVFARANGMVDIAVTTTTGMTVERRDLTSHSEAQAVLNDLRAVLAAQDLDLIQIGGPVLT